MDPIEALKHIRTLIRPAEEIDDAEALQRLLREVRSIVDRALEKPSR